MLKKYFAIILAISLCISMTANAAVVNEPTVSMQLTQAERASSASLLADIPVYITTPAPVSDVAPASATATVETTTMLTETEKAEIVENPLFANTLRRIEEIASSNLSINSVNFRMKKNPLSADASSADPDDPDFWEDHYDRMESHAGIYRGYKFLYSETEISVETSYVEPDNLTSSFNWSNFLGSIVETTTSMFIGDISSIASLVYDTVGSILGSVTSPISVTYGAASGGYIKTAVDGTLYIRDVFISDNLDRIDGYAYYHWATTEQSCLQQAIKSRMPTSQRTSTTYNYVTANGSGSMQTVAAGGFTGSAAFYQEVINYYSRTTGYYIYEELLDMDSIVTELWLS